MKLYDFDAMFDRKLSEFIQKNPDRYTESQWEDVIPDLYKKFGDTFLKQIGDTPNGFYKKFSDKELLSAVKAHIKNGVPVSAFLSGTVESRGAAHILMPLLDGYDEEREYAVNAIGSDESAVKKYMQILSSGKCGEDLKNMLLDKIKEKADLVEDEAVENYERGIERECMLEIMSRSVKRTDKVFEILIKEFRSDDENIPLYAGYLASYGDARALEYLIEKIDREGISYLEYKELLIAIESLGGTYDKERDFSSDPYYDLIKSHEVSATDIFGGTDKKQ